MEKELVKTRTGSVAAAIGGPILPTVIADAGDQAAKRFVEFFTGTIRNPNTRGVYARAAYDFFAWVAFHSLTLADIEPIHVPAYTELLTSSHAAPTV